ncbi:MAG: YafY family protein [Spirochaetales bacterium]|nr:YafY family protein [Spirochaetales bacterium]
MSQKNLFELVYILLDKKSVTAKNLAEHFDVSERTILRWAESLAEAGVPIYSTQGRGGGFAIAENYTLDKTIFTDEEKCSVVSSLKAVAKLTGSECSCKNSAEKTAAQKLSGFVAKNTDWLELDFSPWNPQEKNTNEIFNKLKNAIIEKQQIEFDYFSLNKKTEHRTVQPWKIVFRGVGWYFYGWCNVRCAPRYFKLNRICNLKVLGKKVFMEEKEFGIEQKNSYSVEKEISMIEITAQVADSELYRILDEFAVCKVEKLSSESSIVKFNAPEVGWLVPFLLSFGSAIKIIFPEKIKEQFSLEVKKMSARINEK